MFGLTAKPLCGRYLSFGGAGGDRAPSRSRATPCRRSCSPARASGIDNLQRASAAQRRHPKRRPRGIVRRQRNGTPSALLAAQSRRSLRATGGVKNLCRGNGCLASLRLRAGFLFPARSCPGKAVGDVTTRKDRRWANAWSPEQIARPCRWTSRTTRPCASAMKPSIKRWSFKVEARCAANSTACLRTPGACCGCRGRARAGEARPSSLPRLMIQPTSGVSVQPIAPCRATGKETLSWGLGQVRRSAPWWSGTTRFTLLLYLPRMAGHGHEARVKNGPALAGHGARGGT